MAVSDEEVNNIGPAQSTPTKQNQHSISCTCYRKVEERDDSYDFINASIQSKDSMDTSYNPNDESESDDGDEDDITHEKEDAGGLLLVTWCHLLQLLLVCMKCGAKASITNLYTKGSAIIASMRCGFGHSYIWQFTHLIIRRWVHKIKMKS